MAAVAVALLTHPPDKQTEVPQPDDTPQDLDPNGFEIIADTDTLITACSCSASSDNPYQ
jgi:hypothetical protein